MNSRLTSEQRKESKCGTNRQYCPGNSAWCPEVTIEVLGDFLGDAPIEGGPGVPAQCPFFHKNRVPISFSSKSAMQKSACAVVVTIRMNGRLVCARLC